MSHLLIALISPAISKVHAGWRSYPASWLTRPLKVSGTCPSHQYLDHTLNHAKQLTLYTWLHEWNQTLLDQVLISRSYR